MIVLDVEIYEDSGEESQAKYLVHGYDDVLWTNDPKDVISYLAREIERIEQRDQPV